MPKLLWANMQCLIDPTSGASLSIRYMLKQLKRRGWDIRILGGTCFDSENGSAFLPAEKRKILYDYQNHRGLRIIDGELEHDLVNTNTSDRDKVFTTIEHVYYKTFISLIEVFKPDIIWSYGARPVDTLISADAKYIGACAASYLVNGGYETKRWARDYDTIITDSTATKSLYKKRLGLDLNVIGKFIPRENTFPGPKENNDLLMINPCPEKGGILVVQIAHEIIKRKLSTKIHIAESRGNLKQVVDAVSRHYGVEQSHYDTTIINHGTVTDMASFYKKGKVLLAPSMWYESGARSLAEAMLSGLPVIATDNGGNKEMIGKGGTLLTLPDVFYEKPYFSLLPDENVSTIVDLIEQYLNDPEFYAQKRALAQRQGKITHNMETNGYFLSQHFKKLIKLNSEGKLRYGGEKFVSDNVISVETGNYQEELNLAIQRLKASGKSKLFIDCGGYDGCSVIKFLEKNTDFVSITFEPNPLLHEYYWDVPTELMKVCVGIKEGTVPFTLDINDSDGSSVVKEKQIDSTNIVNEQDFPTIQIECINIVDFIQKIGQDFDEIVLKLDVEGSEYEILRELLSLDQWPTNLRNIYCEFHWEKIGISRTEHDNLLEDLKKVVIIHEDWDALPYRVAYTTNDSFVLNRRALVAQLSE